VIYHGPVNDAAEVDLVRRRLLLAGGKYVAPAILVTLVLDQKAYAQASCQPNDCPPAVNNCGPLRQCRPGRGG
jgi:hypothetical protein